MKMHSMFTRHKESILQPSADNKHINEPTLEPRCYKDVHVNSFFPHTAKL